MPFVFRRNCNKCGRFYKGQGPKYCSQECYWATPASKECKDKISKALTGIVRGPMTEEHKAKMLATKKLKPHPLLGKTGPLCHNYGRKRSLETRIKHSNSIKGDKAPNWQGGKTKEAERLRKSYLYRDWRTAVFQRDNYTCQDCGAHGVYLHAHHLKSFAFHEELRFDVTNGKTLCKPCHEKTENYGTNAFVLDHRPVPGRNHKMMPLEPLATS